MPSSSAPPETEAEVFNLDVARARKFLTDLAENPFACVVLSEDGSLKIVSKDMPEDELARFVEALAVLAEGE